MRRSPNATWAYPKTDKDHQGTVSLVVAMLGGIGAAALIIVVIGIIAIGSKEPEPDDAGEESVPAYTE
jgi:hypothetical protein